MYAVLGLLVIVVLAYYLTQPLSNKETFSDTYAQPPKHDLTIPKTIMPPPPVVKTSPNASQIPGTIPNAPYQQIARNLPYAYQDPALIKTTRQRILDTLELLKGFLAFQANEIEYRSDPTIQLPLITARSDFQRLSSEANVLQRNPGLQPDMTEKEINEINDNLAYLQREVELIGANRPFENTGLQNLEGFQNPGGDSYEPASEDDLKEFSARIQGEILRLSASGTTDPVVNARITNLTNLKNDVDGVLAKIQSGAILSNEVPIQKADIQKALPILGKPTEPLPQILKMAQLPAGLANMLPSAITKDPVAIQQTNSLIQKYAQDFFDGASASVAVRINYTSPREVEIAQSRAGSQKSMVDQTGFPSNEDLDAVANGLQVASTLTPSRVTDPYGNDPRAELRSPAHFNWKERARHIEDQIRRRGIPDNAVGLMPRENRVGQDFSWKGYAKMICSRLQSNFDTGVPEACGCPPGDWKGW
jgi:hypothetical protein